jgi:glutamine synthetase
MGARANGPVRPDPPATSGLAGGRVEQLLCKPPASWDVDDFLGVVRDQGIRLIHLMHVGGDGWLKTLDFLPRSELHLRDILDAGERADGSSLFADVGIAAEASDIVLRPRLASAFFNPFSPLPALAFLCEHLGRDGTPLPESPDTIVRRAHARVLRATGVDLWAHGEVEYFLGKRAGESDIYGSAERGYHATAPFVFGEALRRRAMSILGDLGVGVKYAHSEVGYIEARENDGHTWEQHEIELALAPLPLAADAVLLTQWVLRLLAHESGMQCSFDPVLRRGHAGSGMHFHFSPLRRGVHLDCMDDDGTVHDEARWLIAGLVRFGGSLMAFGNRVDGSFSRLEQGKEAPRSITWGRYNRHALVRLPIQARTAKGRTVTVPTVEFRLPDGSVHPHLLLAGVAQALVEGRDGTNLEALLEGSRSAAAHETRAGTARAVPRSVAAIRDCLQMDRAVFEREGVFPASLLDATLRQLQQRDVPGKEPLEKAPLQ